MNTTMSKTVAATALLATVGGSAVLVAGPAAADVDRAGTCAGATYELGVDRERRGFDVDADLDGARPGSEWRVTLRHDGALAASRVLRADAEGELDLSTWRRDTAGSDTFRLTVTPETGRACSVKVTVR
ncbi:hypothetical protein [Nocardioides sp. SYSU D00065]|uniref:hypothetical protein n=1 Tax=Nocardioides sp. SYSU D00065 TaxID=2817378 RepID=UPI001B323DF6|nr:hypothetical protein [Nocardioides sp. SYSU D00065]